MILVTIIIAVALVMWWGGWERSHNWLNTSCSRGQQTISDSSPRLSCKYQMGPREILFVHGLSQTQKERVMKPVGWLVYLFFFRWLFEIKSKLCGEKGWAFRGICFSHIHLKNTYQWEHCNFVLFRMNSQSLRGWLHEDPRSSCCCCCGWWWWGWRSKSCSSLSIVWLPACQE